MRIGCSETHQLGALVARVSARARRKTIIAVVEERQSARSPGAGQNGACVGTLETRPVVSSIMSNASHDPKPNRDPKPNKDRHFDGLPGSCLDRTCAGQPTTYWDEQKSSFKGLGMSIKPDMKKRLGYPGLARRRHDLQLLRTR